MFGKRIAALVLGLAMAGPAAASDRFPYFAILDGNPALGGGKYSTGGGLTVAVQAQDINGRLALCGVWAHSDALSIYARNSSKRVLSKGSITLNGRVVTHNFDFLTQVRATDNYAGAEARCAVLNQAWQPGYENARLKVRLPQQQVYISSRRSGGAAPRVVFSPSEFANPAVDQNASLRSKGTSRISIAASAY